MATAFEVSLQNFQRYADSIDPKFGALVADVIGTNYISALNGGLGAADDVQNAAVRTTDKLAEMINAVSGTYLKTLEAYYTTKGKIQDLKVQAKGSAVTQAVNAFTPAPSSSILWIGLGIGALLLLTRK